MRASSLASVLAAVALVAVAATAVPTSPTHLPEVVGNKQGPARKKPAPRDSRQGKKRQGQPYHTGHRSVAFLTMGEIDVIRHFPEDAGSVDPCHGCCDVSANYSPAERREEGGKRTTQEPPARLDASYVPKNVNPGVGVNDADVLGSGSNTTADRCLGCCATDDTWTLPLPGGTATEGTGNQESKKSTRNQPSHRPREKTMSRGSPSISSSEEGGAAERIFRRGGGAPAGARTEAAERANIRYPPSQRRKKTSPCQRPGCQSGADVSSRSSSEEA